jgi:serine/threonine protein kinase/Tfp pilus assembly protein PilF
MVLLLIGKTLGHYRVIEKLGAGGMGEVYRAHDEQLDRDVAVKVLPAESFSDPAARVRLLREARAAASLNHPNISTIYGVGEAEGQAYIAMELVEGRPLSHHLADGPLAAEQLLRYGLHIAGALAHAHEHGIVHRDLKCANIVVTPDGRAKVLDFGLAKRLTEVELDEATRSQESLTRPGGIVGTLPYIAPEQLRGLPADARSDIWALGVVLYEMAAGSRPFQGQTGFELSSAILNQEPPPLPSPVPARLRTAVRRCLEKDPVRRYQSAVEVRAALEAIQTSTAAASAPEKSIAVLYFENMSSEKESDYFCAGITEDIITDLSKISGLKVVSRMDVLPFHNKEVNTRQVGETLRVNYILEGSVRKAGNKIRVAAQLINVQDGYHVWAERFDRLVEDIFEVQNEVSQKIANTLKVSLTDSEKQSLAKKPTDDLKAYDFYMRGRELLYRRGKKNNETALRMFETAVAIDPHFAAAYAGLAEAYSCMFEWYDGSQSWLAQAIEMNEKALALDPTSLEARFGIAMLYFHQKRLGESRRRLEEILKEDAQYYSAHLRLGMISELSGEFDAALTHYLRAAELKPYDEDPWRFLVGIYRKLNNGPAAHEAALKVIEVASRKLEASLDDLIVMSRLAEAYARYGAKEETHATLQRVFELDPSDGLALYNCACAYALLGEKREALSSLRRAFDSGFRAVGRWAKADGAFDLLRGEAEFLQLAELE